MPDVTRGHWPLGKRRHPKPLPAELRGRIDRLLADHPRYGVRSLRAIAAHLEVSDRTIRRWLSGEDHPAPEQLTALTAWTRRHERMTAPVSG